MCTLMPLNDANMGRQYHIRRRQRPVLPHYFQLYVLTIVVVLIDGNFLRKNGDSFQTILAVFAVVSVQKGITC